MRDIKKEYDEIAGSLVSSLELMNYAGVTGIPIVKPGTPEVSPEGEGWVTSEGFKKTEGDGAVFGLWKVGEALFVNGSGISGVGEGGPFSEEEDQLSKILVWVASETGVKYSGERSLFSSIKNTPPFDIKTAISNCSTLIDEKIANFKPKVIVALGPEAAFLFTVREDIKEARGRFHSYKNIMVMPTYSPLEILRRRELRGDIFEDMKMVVKELKGL
ncbi:MAG: hypothetical protein HY954_08310 [Deltaproteobacteria bacterium]|nr:hypothetical protein [Deltaproteobacteria bacterium]